MSFSKCTPVIGIACFFWASQTLAASSCSTVPDLSTGLGAVFNQNDDQINACFAMATADQLTQKMLHEGLLAKGERIDPLALWALYILDNRRVPNDSVSDVSTPSNVLTSLVSLKKRELNMLCKEADLQGTDQLTSLFTAAGQARMNEFRKRLESLSRGPCKLDPRTSSELEQQSRQVLNAAYFTWWDFLKEKCRTSIPPFSWVWHWASRRSKALIENRTERWPAGANQFLAAKIDQGLQKGSIVAIEYQHSFLSIDGLPYMHWSSIVARQEFDGRCYYKIRDSLGSNCTQYKNPSLCHAGYVSVKREDLLNHSDSLSYLE